MSKTTSDTIVSKLGDLNLDAQGTNNIVTLKDLKIAGGMVYDQDYNTSTGSAITLALSSKPQTHLTGAGLVSIAGINGAVTLQKVRTIINFTGADVKLLHSSSSAASGNKLIFADQEDYTLKNNAAITFMRDATAGNWISMIAQPPRAKSTDTIALLTASEDLSTWSTGNNAAFLGGGTISGAFVKDTTTPLNDGSSYKFTQGAGSLNDYFASAVQPVSLGYRGGQVIIYFPYQYNGSGYDIQVILYCATTGAILNPDTYLPVALKTSIFRSSPITIPDTCTGVRVGFMVKSLSSGAVFAFDDVRVSRDLTAAANLQNQTQSTRISATSQNPASLNFNTLSPANDGGGLYTIGTGGFTFLRKCEIFTTHSNYGGTTDLSVSILLNGTSVGTDRSRIATAVGLQASVSVPLTVYPGDVVTYSASGAASGSTLNIQMNAVASNPTIVSPPETFSTDNAKLTWYPASSYTLANLDQAPIGALISFTYAANGNVRTQATSAPTQTTASMNANGIQIFTRAYNAASTAGNPACIAIQIGKGLKGVTKDLYKSTGKVNAGSLDYALEAAGGDYGARLKEYNEVTGILVIDAGIRATAITSANFLFSDATAQSNGYLVINASKNPALVGITPFGNYDVFNSDTASFMWANAATYTLSTLSTAPIGTYITFTYAANGNVRTQTTGTNRPTQTDADISLNGIQIFTRAYNAASTSGNPTCVAIQIGKGMKGVTKDLYKSAGKTIAGSLDAMFVSAAEYGMFYKEYNEATGILVLDAGVATGATTSKTFQFSDTTSQTNGYVVINASKSAVVSNVTFPTTASDIEITDATKGIIMKSPNGTRWRMGVSNAGATTWTTV